MVVDDSVRDEAKHGVVQPGCVGASWVSLARRNVQEGPPRSSAPATAGRCRPLAQSGGPQLQMRYARGCCCSLTSFTATAISDTVRSTVTRVFCRYTKAQRACHSRKEKKICSASSILSPRPSVGLAHTNSQPSCFVRAGSADELLPTSFTQPLQKEHSRKNGRQRILSQVRSVLLFRTYCLTNSLFWRLVLTMATGRSSCCG